MNTRTNTPAAYKSNSTAWSRLAQLLAVCSLGVSLSACASQVRAGGAAQAPRENAPLALTYEPTEVIHGQRPGKALPATPDVRQAVQDRAEEVSVQERKARRAAASAALGRAGRIGSKSIGQSARWSSLNR